MLAFLMACAAIAGIVALGATVLTMIILWVTDLLSGGSYDTN